MKLTPDDEHYIHQLDNLPEAVSLLKAYALQEPKLHTIVHQATWGIDHQFHFGHHAEGRFKEHPKLGYINIAGLELHYEQLWEELSNRLALVKKHLLEHIKEDDNTTDRWATDPLEVHD